MADKYQVEASRTLNLAGFIAIKPPDFMPSAFGKKNYYPVADRPDTFFAGHHNQGGFVEVKTGRGKHQQRFPFEEWRDGQRAWYIEKAKPANAAYWLFITFGRDIRNKKYPRITLLITAQRLLDFEAQATKKSMSHEEAMQLDDGKWTLSWVGDNQWCIPKTHPFYKLHMEVKHENKLYGGSRYLSRKRIRIRRRSHSQKLRESPAI